MALKIKILLAIAGAFLVMPTLFLAFTPTVLAATSVACKKFETPKEGSAERIRQCEDETPTRCKNIDRSTEKGEDRFIECLTSGQSLKENPIVKQLNNIVKFLSAGVAIVVIGMIIVGGIQYAIAGDNPTAVSAAKKRITDALLAFVVFLFTFAFLQWLIPGGIFN